MLEKGSFEYIKKKKKRKKKIVKKGFTKEGSADIISTVALRGEADKRKHER